MKWKAFIDRLRAEMPRYASDVDADEIWKGIEPAVDKINLANKRRRNRGLLPLILLLGLAIAGGGYLVFNGKSTPASANGLADTSAKSTEDKPGDVHDVESSDDVLVGESKLGGNGGNEMIAEKEGVERELTATTLDKQSSQYQDQEIGGGDASAVANKEKFDSPDKNKAREGKKWRYADDKKSLSDRASKKYSNIEGKRKATRTDNKADHQPDEPLTAMSAQAKDLVTYPPVHATGEFTTGAGQISGNTVVQGNAVGSGNGMIQENVLMASLDARTSLMLQEYSVVNNNQSLNINVYQRKAPVTDCPTFGKGRSGMSFLIGVRGGASYPFRSLSSTEPGSELMMLRDTTEQSLVSGDYAIDFAMRHKSGIEFRTGIQSMTLLEKLDLKRTITETRTETGIIAISINPMGDTVYINGEVPITTTTSERKRYYNKYKFVEIPVIIGYSTDIKNWRVGGEVGLIPGFLTKTEGKILDENAEFVDLDDNNPAINGKNFGLSYYFGASVTHMYESGVELGFHPHVRFSPTDFAAADYPVRTKYVMLGLDISIRYRFGRK